MDKSDLIDDFHEELKKAGFSTRHSDSKKIFNIFLDVLTHRLKSGYMVHFRGFGKFESKLRKFNNVHTGGLIERFVLKFYPSKELKDKLNEKIH